MNMELNQQATARSNDGNTLKHYDLCVLGAGSGGVRAARMASQAGARVAIVEQGRFGGTCVNLGCVPKKLYVIASGFRRLFSLARDYGWSEPQSDFAFEKLKQAKDREIARLNNIYQSVLTNAGVTSYSGHARLSGDGIVSIDAAEGSGQQIHADRILIATGSSPALPSGLPGVELAMVSDDVFGLEYLPRRFAIYGGGYIAVEFACIFNALGIETHLVYRGDQLLRAFDHETATKASEAFTNAGLNLHLNTTIQSIEQAGSGRLLRLATGDRTDELKVDLVLLATGRTPNTDKLGLEQIGIKTRSNGSIIVGEDYQTSVSGIFALGDVTGGAQLTPMAIAEAMDFVRQQFDAASKHRLPESIPTVIFSQPNLATVGLSEQQAQQEIQQLSIYTSQFKPLQDALNPDSDERVFMKVLVDAHTDRVVGIHMVGDNAGEIIQGFAAAMEAGLTKATLDTTLGIHPTTAEEFVSIYQVTR